MPDLERKPSRRRRVDLDVENVPMAPAVFTQMGKRAHTLKRYIAAMRLLDRALELDPEGTQALEPRANALIGLAYYKEALEELNLLDGRTWLAGRDLSLRALLLRIQAMWHAGEFEGAAILASRAMRVRRQPPDFAHMYVTCTAAVEQCIGQSAGECLVELREYIHTIAKLRKRISELKKMKNPPRPPRVTDAKTDKQISRERRYEEYLRERRLFLTNLYMGGALGRDWEFASGLLANTGLVSNINRQSVERIKRYVDFLSETMNNRLETMENECPLYTLRYRAETRTSPQLRTRREEALEHQRRLAAAEAFNSILRILEARAEGERKAITNTISSSRNFLENISTKLLPNRQDFILLLYHLLGIVFLEVKLLRLQSQGTEARERERREHVRAILGVSKEVDLVVKDAQMPFVDYRAELRLGDHRLKHAKSKLERLVITYEMAYCYAKIGKWDNCLNFSRRAFTMAKELGHLVWGINAAVALAKAEFHLNTRIEARASIKEALEMAYDLNDEYVLEMLHAVSDEIEHPTLEAVGEAKDSPQARMLRLMATPELRMECRNLLAHMDAMPPECRLSLHARWKDKQDEGRQRARQPLALFHKT